MEAEQLDIALPTVLDACCGPRMFWFDSQDRRALFIDKRQETHPMDLGTESTRGRAPSVIAPDIVADFTAMPFADESFYLVVFDPPHIMRHRGGLTGCFSKKYGMLPSKWPDVLRAGFAECFRVLKPNGTLVFKWADTNIPVSQVLMTTPHKPLFGSRRAPHTHWYVFMKERNAPQHIESNAMSNPTQWNVEVAAMLAAVDWARERELDRTPLRLQDLADHYAAKKNLPQIMVRSAARELIQQRLGLLVCKP